MFICSKIGKNIITPTNVSIIYTGLTPGEVILILVCSGTEANVNFECSLLSNVAGKAPTNTVPSTHQNIQGDIIPSRYINDTDIQIHITTKRWKNICER